MTGDPSTATSPSGDDRCERLDITLRRVGFQRDALIEVLHSAQSIFGYLERGVLAYIARRLKLPLARVQGVATFYHLFTLEPPARHNCTVCYGTSCHLAGAPAILRALEGRFGLLPDAGSTKGVSLQITRCTGTCALAPLVELDEAVLANCTADEVTEHVGRWLHEA